MVLNKVMLYSSH